MKAIPHRPITEQESAIVRKSLQRAALHPVEEETLQSIGALKVKAECECGCRTIEFDVPDGKEHMLADGLGYLDTGELLNIIIWGRSPH